MNWRQGASRILWQILPVVWAAAAGAAEIPDTKLFLPVVKGLGLDWVLRTDGEPVRRQPDHFVFDVDAKGQPWFGSDQSVFLNPLKGYVAKADVPYEDFAWLDTGDLLVCTRTQLGYLDVSAGVRKDEDDVPIVPFRPFLRLPDKYWHLFAGSGSVLYLVGSEDRWRRSAEVYVLSAKDGKGSMEKIFSTEESIGSVAGDGERTYVAVGKLILTLKPGKSARGIFLHPKEDIVRLAFSPDVGLIYATGGAVGYIGDAARFEFMKTPAPAIRLRGNSLYVLLGKTYGVIRIDGISAFKNLGTAAQVQPLAQPAVEKTSEPPARVEKPLSPVETDIFCPKCRMVNDGTAKFCTNCGGKLKP